MYISLSLSLSLSLLPLSFASLDWVFFPFFCTVQVVHERRKKISYFEKKKGEKVKTQGPPPHLFLFPITDPVRIYGTSIVRVVVVLWWFFFLRLFL